MVSQTTISSSVEQLTRIVAVSFSSLGHEDDACNTRSNDKTSRQEDASDSKTLLKRNLKIVDGMPREHKNHDWISSALVSCRTIKIIFTVCYHIRNGHSIEKFEYVNAGCLLWQ